MFHRPSIAETDAHHLLSNARRREILTILWRRSAAVTVRELSELIAASEAGVSPAPRPLRESVYNTLHRTHLPTLDEFGLVEYDADRKLVRPGAGSRQVSRYMDTLSPIGLSWGEYYRGLGIGAMFAVVGSLADVPPFGAVDPLLIASGSLAVFAVSAVYQLCYGPRSRLRGLVDPRS